MKKMFFIAPLCLLISCASQQQYDNYIKSFYGSSEQELIKANGIPDGNYEIDGTRYIIYNKNSVTSFNGMSSSLTCKTIYEVQDKKVVNATYSGNHCIK